MSGDDSKDRCESSVRHLMTQKFDVNRPWVHVMIQKIDRNHPWSTDDDAQIDSTFERLLIQGNEFKNGFEVNNE